MDPDSQPTDSEPEDKVPKLPKLPSDKLTYTTAGTPYNPNASQSLQPPTRRARTIKPAPGSGYTNYQLFPKGILTSLRLMDGLGPRKDAQRYTPLQQNYDRAVSPVLDSPILDSDHASLNMSAKAPPMPSGNTMSSVPSSLFSDEQDKSDQSLSESSDDDEFDISKDILMNMSVKSLHNLSSYPNPSQKLARKVLARSFKPVLESESAATKASAPSTPCTPLPQSFVQNEVPKKRSASPINLKTGYPDPVFLSIPQSDGVFKPDVQRSTNLWANNSDKAELGDQSNPGLQPAPPSITLSSGTGAPQPLTAGPPGQRQYRPSTFESTFKALKPETSSQEVNTDEDLAFRQDLLSDSAIKFDFLAEPLSPGLTAAGPISPEPYAAPIANDDVFGDMDYQLGNDLALNRIYPYQQYNGMCAPIWGWPHEACYPYFTRNAATYQAQAQWPPWRKSGEYLAVHQAKVDDAWYSGAGFMNMTKEELVEQTAPKRTRKNPFGAIGDGRPTKTRDAKVAYQKIQIGDANHIPTAEHAKPLLRMAYASMVHHAEAEKNEADPTEMDDEPEYLGIHLLNEDSVGEQNTRRVLFGKVDGQRK